MKQGDPLSAVQFNMLLEHVIRLSKVRREGTVTAGPHQCTAYVDDVTIIIRLKEELKQVVGQKNYAHNKVFMLILLLTQLTILLDKTVLLTLQKLSRV